MSMFDNVDQGDSLALALNQLGTQLQQHGVTSMATAANTKQFLSLGTESITASDKNNLFTAANSLKSTLESIVSDLGMGDKFSKAQIEAGVAGAMLAADPKSVLATPLQPITMSNEGMHVVSIPAAEQGSWNRPVRALEAYNENENRDATLFNIKFNMGAAKLDEFNETLFPTIVVPSNQAGVAINVSLPLVFEAVERRLNADKADFAKKNIVRAIVNPEILARDVNLAIPRYRLQQADKFVDQAVIAPRDVTVDGKTVKTAPILFNKDLDYIQLSMPDQFISNQTLNQTDALEAAVDLTTVYVKFGDDILKFNTLNLQNAAFTYTPNSNYRGMQVMLDSDSIVINKDTKTFNGGPLVSLADVVANDVSIRVRLIVNGTINIETGDLRLSFGGADIRVVRNAAGELVALSDASLNNIKAAFAAVTGLGYELRAYHSNANRRMRGDLIDVTRYSELVNIPFRAPISAVRPVTSNTPEQAADVENLLQLIRTRLSGEGVRKLQEAKDILAAYVDARDPLGVGPDVLGVGRYWVIPTYKHDAFDGSTVQSLNSNDRISDIKSALVNMIRDVAYQLHLESEYEPCQEILSGGVSTKPTLIIATDPYIANYLMIDGELRLAGPRFEYRVVASYNKNMRGKIFLTFGVMDENRNTAVNPLNFGNFFYSAELVTVINQSRGETISNETTVTPRYKFQVNLPVLGYIEVTNLPTTVRSGPFAVKTL